MNLFKRSIIKILNKLPYIRGLYKENLELKSCTFFPHGHFYSPVVSYAEINNREKEIWNDRKNDHIAGIDLNTREQIQLVNELSNYYRDLPFSEKPNETRYRFDNNYYSYSDGILLYSMIRHFEPQTIIEIGSGFSSAVMLDTNELFFKNQIDLTFIEPYPDRLNTLLTETDNERNHVICREVQDLSLDIFRELKPNDILFVDSSHVVKTGSDVNFILFQILPVLQKGVIIHFHDVFYPFEYPREWVFQGRNWNETYFLKSFLMHNDCYKIRLFSHYLHEFHQEVFKNMPLCYNNKGSNLWVEKM